MITILISLAPVATGFPAHLVPLGLPQPKQPYHLCTLSLLGQTQVLQGSPRSRLLWMAHIQRWDKIKAEPQGWGNQGRGSKIFPLAAQAAD